MLSYDRNFSSGDGGRYKRAPAIALSAYVAVASITGSRESRVVVGGWGGGVRCSQMCSEDKMQAKCMKVCDAGRSSTHRCKAAAKIQDQKSQSPRDQAGPPEGLRRSALIRSF